MNQPSISVTNTKDKSTEKKWVFMFIHAFFSVHDHFGPVTVNSIAVRPHGGDLFSSCKPGSKERHRKGPGSWYSLQGHAPSGPALFHWAPSPKSSTTSKQHHRVGATPSYMGLWGTLKIQAIVALLTILGKISIHPLLKSHFSMWILSLLF